MKDGNQRVLVEERRSKLDLGRILKMLNVEHVSEASYDLEPNQGIINGIYRK